MVDIYNQFKDFKAFEVVFTDKDQQQQTLFCTVKSIENDRIVLDSNNQSNNNIFADADDELKLYIYTENGIYSATSKVLTVSKGLVNTEYVISYPANSKHSQRREYFRADMPVDFQMRITSDTPGKDSVVIKGTTRNICGKGMSYVSGEHFPTYSSIDLHLIFPDKTVDTTATFVYAKQIVVGSHPKFVYAFVFNNISQKNIDFIVKKCFLHQLDLKKRQHQQ